MATESKTNDIQLSFTPEYEVVGTQPMKLMFNAHLTAPLVVEDATKRSTISLTAVIDKSGSMQGNKLELVKKTCNFMLNQLSNTDKLGLVEYDTHVNELIPLSQSNGTFKTEAASVINRMTTGSATNLSGGLFEGVKQQQGNKFVNWETTAQPTTAAPETAAPEPMEIDEHGPMQTAAQTATSVWSAMWSNNANNVQQQAPQQQQERQQRWSQIHLGSQPLKFFPGRKPGPSETVDEDALRSVFLFTDGLANNGITATEELVAALGQRLDGSPRVRVYTFGFGSDHSPALLAELARVGAGTYYFMEKEESIPTAFADALGGLLSVAAQNVTVEFMPAPGVTVSAVHSAFTSSEAPGGARRIAVGDLLSEEGKDLLLELELLAWEGEAAELSVGKLVVSYLDVQGACLRSQELDCKVKRAREVPAGVVRNEGVALQRARIETAAGMAEARRAAERGDLAGARAQLQACLEQVDAVSSESAFKAQLCQDLREAQTNMVDRQTYATRGSKLMWAKGKAHMEQRSACLSDDEDEDEQAGRCTFSYANVQQKSMRAMAKRECK